MSNPTQPAPDAPVTVVTGADSGIGRATAIHLAAITTDEPRLRYPVSWGGAELAELHDRIDDSDWVAMGAIEEDDDYYRTFHDVFGLDLR